MSAPPTTRASRSRYSSPAVGGGLAGSGGRLDGSSRGRGADKDKARASTSSNAAASSAARTASTERSRRFMENWIEPERVRLPSFQEHGLVRQGVLETMEPLGTVPKPALIKKLTAAGKEGSPTPSARLGKKKKIILTRKNGPSIENSAMGAATAAATAASSTLGLPELMSDLQSASPSTVATPQPETSPNSTPAPANLPEQSPVSVTAQNSSPALTPTPKMEQPDTPTILQVSDASSERTPEPQVEAMSQPAPSPPNPWDNIHRDHLRPQPSTSSPFLPDPIKESIEGTAARNLPGTPQSVHSSASTYDSVTDEYYKRGTSMPSRSLFNMPYRRVAGVEGVRSVSLMAADEDPVNVPARVQGHVPHPPLGPWYIDSEFSRILKQKDVVKKAIDHAVAEAVKYRCYNDAYALRFAFDDNQDNARFLLQTEAAYRQMATKEAAGEWARTLLPYKEQGQENLTALKYFVPDAATDKDVDAEAHKPLQAPFAHLVSIDMSEVRTGRRKAAASTVPEPEVQIHNDDDNQNPAQPRAVESHPHGTQDQPEMADQSGRVATPPRKRQKTQIQTRDSFHVGEAPTPSGYAMDNMDGCTDAAPAAHRHTRAGSNVSDVSTLSSARSITPVEEPEEEATQAGPTAQLGEVQASMQGVQDGEQDAQEVKALSGAGEVAGVAAVNGSNTAKQAAVPGQPITEPLRRLPARNAKILAPNIYLQVPPAPDSYSNSEDPQFHSHSHSHSSNLADNLPTPDPMSLGKQPDDNGKEGAHTTATSSTSSLKPPKRSQRGLPDYAPTHKLDPTDSKVLMRTAAQKKTHDLTQKSRAKDDSFIRGESLHTAIAIEARPGSSSSSLSSAPEVEVELEVDEMDLSVAPAASTAFVAVSATPAGASTRAKKRNHDEAEEGNTPFAADFGGEGAMSTGALSRAATPRPQKKQKQEGRRFKQSPIKNKAGPSAAAGVVPTRAVNRSSPVVAPSNQEDNDDYCSFCNGSGNLVCCDGCNKAFHYMCHEPVVDPNEDAAWFCWDCMVKRDPGLVGEYKGPFAALMANLDKRHAKAFVLPKKVKDYFEGVRTGADGEYEEFVPPIKGKKKKDTEDDKKKDFDFFQLVDKDNNSVLCHSCCQSAEGSSGRRAIVPCSLCGLWWHADCLDPPKATPPNPRTFVCPCHIDDLLSKVPAQLGPAHRFRKIKGSSEINYAFRRGNINNGWIEVDDDLSEDEARRTQIRLREPASWGTKYLIPASGIRDDFITAIGRPRDTRPSAGDDGEDAESRYEGALSMLALSRNYLTANDRCTITDQNIETADQYELEKMQQQVQQLQEKISAQLRLRGGQQESQHNSVMGQDSKQAAVRSKSEQRIDASADLVDDSATVSEPSELDVVQEAGDSLDGSIEFTPKGLSGQERDTAKGSVNESSLSAVNASPPMEEPDGFVRSANGKDMIAENGLGRDTIVKATAEKSHDQAVDAVLTPPADSAKDGDDFSSKPKAGKPTSNGVETPETTIPDQATSPPEADGMSIDEFNLD